MAENLINQTAAQDQESWDAATSILENALPTDLVDAASDLGGIIVAAAVEAAKHGGNPLSFGVQFWVGGKLFLFDVVLDTLGTDSWQKAVAKNLAGQVAGVVTGAAMGLVFSGAAAGVASVAVGYFASEFVTNSIGEAWDYYIGPEIGTSYDEDRDALTITTNGKLSDTLQNYWDGVEVEQGGKTIDLKLGEFGGQFIQFPFVGGIRKREDEKGNKNDVQCFVISSATVWPWTKSSISIIING